MRGGWRSFEKHDFRERGANQSVEENSGVEEEEEIEGFERAVCGVEVRIEMFRNGLIGLAYMGGYGVCWPSDAKHVDG